MRFETAQHHPSTSDGLLAALVPGARLVDTFEEEARVGDLRIPLVGLVAEVHGLQVTASGAGEHAATCASFELVERALVRLAADRPGDSWLEVRDWAGARLAPLRRDVAFPESPNALTRHSLSNGVACGRTWEQACDAAYVELVERDRILRSWLGQTRPESVYDSETTELGNRLQGIYDVRAVTFPSLDPSDLVRVAGVIGLPIRGHVAPLAYGFGASYDTQGALAKAAREFKQRLGFLWGEEIPTEIPEIEPTAAFHQEHYLLPRNHSIIRNWIDGGFAGPHRRRRQRRRSGTRFVELAANDDVSCSVVKAMSSQCEPLTFGTGTQSWRRRVPRERWVHPIA